MTSHQCQQRRICWLILLFGIISISCNLFSSGITTQPLTVTQAVLPFQTTQSVEVISTSSETNDLDLTSTPSALTQPGTVLNDGETWYVNGWSLTVKNFTYKTLSQVEFVLQNNTDRAVLFPGTYDDIKLVSDGGDDFSCIYEFGPGQSEIRPHEQVKWITDFGTDAPGCHYDRDISPSARKLTLTVGNLSDVIINAKWQAEIPRP
jgi:hypothetical protein